MHGLIPFFQYFLASTINEFNKGVFAGESAFIFSVLANLPMKTFNNVSRVNDTPELFRVFKIL